MLPMILLYSFYSCHKIAKFVSLNVFSKTNCNVSLRTEECDHLFKFTVKRVFVKITKLIYASVNRDGLKGKFDKIEISI
ncbi:hypothetical protein T08_11753 [Trichinella sp. T8]|nr:hypothetical protein T08_11753 [Trichinella sp. T8]